MALAATMRGSWSWLLVVGCSSAGQGGSASTTSSSEGSTGTTVGDESTGDGGGTTGEEPLPLPCLPPECPAGELGCPCAAEDACAVGACSGGRCVDALDGMVRVPEGEFCMGCTNADDPWCVSHELPAHRIRLSEYWIDRTEVTQAAYAACVADGACAAPLDTDRCSFDYRPTERPDFPMTCVSFADAAAYCGFLGRRLPSEAEWEKAARGRAASTYPWGEQAADCTLANFGRDDEECVQYGDPLPVDTHRAGAGPYGAVDQAGNVWEWTADWYAPDAYDHHDPTDPLGPESGSAKVVRGGSFNSDPKYLRTSARDGSQAPFAKRDSLGFRCARAGG